MRKPVVAYYSVLLHHENNKKTNWSLSRCDSIANGSAEGRTHAQRWRCFVMVSAGNCFIHKYALRCLVILICNRPLC